jgi:hypothetical protein
VERRRVADAFLSHTSWDGTWTRINQLLDAVMRPSSEPARTA